MLKHFAFVIIIAVFSSCTNHPENVNLQERMQSDTSGKASEVLFAEPGLIDSSHVIYYPLFLEKASYSSSYLSKGGGERTAYWNLIFHNTDSNTQHLLAADRKVLIYSINVDKDASGYTSPGNGINISRTNIFYQVVTKDFNQDQYLDGTDPTYLFISDKQGYNFRQLSPDNYNVTAWEIVKGTSKLILQAQKDDNGDKLFNGDDKTVPLILDLATQNMATEVFNQNYVDSLKNTLSKTWKASKK